MNDILNMYDSLASKAESRNRSVDALREMKRVEKQMEGKLRYKKIMNGYVLTTRPENFKGYEDIDEGGS